MLEKNIVLLLKKKQKTLRYNLSVLRIYFLEPVPKLLGQQNYA